MTNFFETREKNLEPKEEFSASSKKKSKKKMSDKKRNDDSDSSANVSSGESSVDYKPVAWTYCALY